MAELIVVDAKAVAMGLVGHESAQTLMALHQPFRLESRYCFPDHVTPDTKPRRQL
ncbi:hypothetical protein [Alcanivorax xiamenensis]|uniref:hypothetical protein n=1 Tax=Alcanivorax xiamenensis TaxID=1177156 RepID=UPI00191500E7|nr:hypothetical protein [Alcanivorax xiamenensis]